MDDLDAGELRLVLVQVVHLLLGDGGLDVIGVSGSPSCSATSRASRRGGTSSTSARRRTMLVASLLRHVSDPELDGGAGDVGDDRPPVPVEDRARAAPPRRTSRSWLFWAALRYSSPESTWSDQSRRKRSAKRISATAPRMPTRSASGGVSRYGSRTLGSGGRKRSDSERRSWYAPSDKDLDLLAPARRRRASWTTARTSA